MDKLVKYLKAGQRVLLVGDPGLGKTAIAEATAKAAGFDFISTSLGLMERVDLSGGFVPDRPSGVMRQLPLELMHRIMNQPEDRGLVWFVDDLCWAPIDVQGALKSTITRGANKIPPHVAIWGATNRPANKTGAGLLNEALRTEFDRAFLMPTPSLDWEREKTTEDGGTYLCSWNEHAENWCFWANDAGCPPIIIAYHQSTGYKNLYQWKPVADPAIRFADFRAWESVFRGWNKGLRDHDDIASCIGKPLAKVFLAYASMAHNLPTLASVWQSPLTAIVPTDPSSQWLIACMLANEVKGSVVTQFMQYVKRLPEPLTMFSARLVGRRFEKTGNQETMATLSTNLEWLKWQRDNPEYFQEQ